MELPRLFDERAELIELDEATLAALPPEAIKRLDVIRRSYAAVKEAERNDEAADEKIAAALAQVIAAEEAVKPYGPYDFHRLWLQEVHGV